MAWLIFKTLIEAYQKQTENHAKILLFIILDASIKEIVDYENIYCVNFLHYIINKADGYIEEDNGNEYLFFAFSGKNKEILTKYTELWDKIECLNQTINRGKAGE